AAVQKGLSAFPRAERINYVLQRFVTHKLPTPEDRLRRKFARGLNHLEAYERYGPPRPLSEAAFYEFGAGWDLAIPLTFWMLGADHQLLVDIRPNLHLALVNVNLERLARLAPELEQQAGRALRAPDPTPLRSPEELEQRFGIDYRAPWDARRTRFEPASV